MDLPAIPSVTQRDFMERELGFEMDGLSPGDEPSMVCWRGHGIQVTVPAKFADKPTLVLAVINAAKLAGSRQRAAAIREALGVAGRD